MITKDILFQENDSLGEAFPQTVLAKQEINIPASGIRDVHERLARL
jgi:hypothetical protein